MVVEPLHYFLFVLLLTFPHPPRLTAPPFNTTTFLLSDRGSSPSAFQKFSPDWIGLANYMRVHHVKNTSILEERQRRPTPLKCRNEKKKGWTRGFLRYVTSRCAYLPYVVRRCGGSGIVLPFGWLEFSSTCSIFPTHAS